MKTLRASYNRNHGGFTLIELLVVIAIIAVLAAMVFPVVGFISKKKIITKAQTELSQVQVFIGLYKDKYNTFPPDNPGQPALSPLYYELAGTTLASGTYTTLDKTESISSNALVAAFGPAIQGLVNTTRGGGEDASKAKQFFVDLKPGQSVQGVSGGANIRLLTCTIQWAKDLPSLVPAFTPSDATVKPNPWQYNSSSPTHNPDSYDLWVDVIISGKTNRISNWSKTAQIVGP